MKKKPKTAGDPDMLPEYDPADGRRGKYARRYAKGTNLVALDPEVAKVFPDWQSVNEALRTFTRISRCSTRE